MGTSRTRCFVCERWVDHCTCSAGPTTLNPAFNGLVSGDIEKGILDAENAALRARLTKVEAELAREREDARDIPTIAYMSGAADWKARATRAEAELAKVREASALLVGEEIVRASKAEAERDEARAKLLETVEQGCLGVDGKLDSMALSAYADAIRALAKAGLVTIEKDFGRRVIATVNERGQAALAECGEV